MIIIATLKRRFVCRCVFSCGVELGPQVTWCGTACAAHLNGSCQARGALEILPKLHRDVKIICLNSLKTKLVLQVLILRNACVCYFGGFAFRAVKCFLNLSYTEVFFFKSAITFTDQTATV